MTQLAKIDDHQDQLLGEQLTEQYDRATGGMREVLKFGAMMMMTRAHLVSKLDTARDSSALPRGSTSDGGLKKWLEEYAPTIKRPTAYRFEDVAKAVQKAYQLPVSATKRLTFEQLITAIPKDLGEAEKKAQLSLFEFVDGTSQKSLLDQFHEPGERGGDTSGSHKKLTPEEEQKLFLEAARNDFATAIMSLDRLHDKELWKAPSIKDAELEASVELMREMAKAISAWLKVPKRERTHLAAAVEEAE